MRVSVLLPVHGAVERVSGAMDTTLAECNQEHELVVVMDRCQEELITLLREYKQNHSNIKLIESLGPGVAKALNSGLPYCNGEYIARMDSDDLMPQGRLAAQAEFLDANRNYGLVSGLVKFESAENSAGYQHYCEQLNGLLSHEAMFESRFMESPVAHPSVMFRKSLIESYGDYTLDALPEDYELWLRWFSKGIQFAKLNQEVLVWRDSGKRASRILPAYSRAAFDEVRMLYLIPFLKQIVKADSHIVVAGAGKYARKKIEQLFLAGLPVSYVSDLIERKINQLEFIPFSALLPAPGRIVISFVSNRGAWIEIKAALTNRGFQTGFDYFPCG